MEYDHADIYPNIEAIEAQFQKLISLVKDEGAIIAFKDDERLMKLKGQRRFSLSSLRKEEFASPEVLTALKEARYDEIHSFWKVSYLTKEFGEIGFNAEMGGDHNFANISQILTLIQVLAKAAVFKKTPTKETIANAFQTFKGVKRRLDLLAKNVEIEVYEDFAHHPTAVKAVIEGFRKMKPNKRLIVCFEPKNATSRRNTFFKEYVEVLKLADQVFLGACPADQKIKEEERMDVPLLAKSVGAKAQSFEDNMMLLESLQSFIKPKDAVIFMSSGSFAGIQHRFAEFINLKKI